MTVTSGQQVQPGCPRWERTGAATSSRAGAAANTCMHLDLSFLQYLQLRGYRACIDPTCRRSSRLCEVCIAGLVSPEALLCGMPRFDSKIINFVIYFSAIIARKWRDLVKPCPEGALNRYVRLGVCLIFFKSTFLRVTLATARTGSLLTSRT